MPQQSEDLLEFDEYCIDVRQRVLLSRGAPIPLPPKVFDTLLALAEQPGRVLEKDHLLATIWPDTFVEEGSLARNVSTLRKVLGPSKDSQVYIETIPTRGYRFTATIHRRANHEQAGARDVAPPAIHAADTTDDEVSLPPPSRRRPWLLWAGGLVLVVTGAIAAWAFFTPTPPGETIGSIAVLPFLNLTGDEGQEYFSDGLTEEVINALANIPGLRVVSRTTVFQFKNHAGDIRELGRRMNADAVMEGSVRREKGRLRVTVQLNSVQDGYHYWSRTWDNDGDGALAIQQGVATQVAQSLRPSEAGVSVTRRPRTTNAEAYNLYLQGRFHSRRGSAASTVTALSFYRRAIARDPSFAEAYVGLALLLNDAATGAGFPPSEAFPQARAALAKALELDPLLPSAYIAKGMIALHYDWDWTAAGVNLRRAVELSPDDAEAHHALSHYLLVMGRFPESLAASRRAIEIDPLNAGMLSHLVLHYLLVHDFANAIDAMKSALDIDPAAPQAWDWGIEAYQAAGRFDDAIGARGRQGQRSELIAALETGLAADGARGYWSALRDYNERHEKHDGSLVMAFVRLGQHQAALDELERAVSEKSGGVVYVHLSPIYDGLRDTPRFKALVARIGLPAIPPAGVKAGTSGTAVPGTAVP